MPGYLKLLLIFILLLYIINPYDLLPDFFPILGWLDDAALTGILLYFLRKGRLPGFLFRQGYNAFTSRKNYQQTYYSDSMNKDGANPETDGSTKFKTPYEILGLKPDAGPEEIRTAYRQEAQAYHPDKVAHLGPELREMANKKFIEIQKAYDELSKTV